MSSVDGYIREKGYDWRAFYCDDCGELTRRVDLRDGLCSDCQPSVFSKDNEVVVEDMKECYLCGYEYTLSEISTEIVDGSWHTVCSNCDVDSDSESPEKPTVN